MVGSSQKFFLIFLITTFTFSFFSYQSSDVVIVGPTFSQEDYFIEELNTISNKTGYKISYVSLNDVPLYIQKNPDKADLVLLTSPQSLRELGNSNILLPTNDFYDEDVYQDDLLHDQIELLHLWFQRIFYDLSRQGIAQDRNAF